MFALKALVNGGIFESLPLAKFTQAYFFPVKFDQYGDLFSSSLFLVGRPFAVLRRIVAIVVYSINSVFWRWISHVAIECCETASPFGAYFDSSASVVFELPEFWVVASGGNSAPNHVDFSSSHSVEFSFPGKSVHCENSTSVLGECR